MRLGIIPSYMQLCFIVSPLALSGFFYSVLMTFFLFFCRCDEYSRQFDYSEMAMLNHSDMSACKLSKSMVAVIAILTVFVASLGTITIVLSRKVRLLGRRPRIKKRIVVNKSITPLTCRPPQQENQQCEITIENCCNMNICETVSQTRSRCRKNSKRFVTLWTLFFCKSV